MTKHRIKIDYNLLSPVEIYQLILAGKIKRFPHRFWSEPDATENAIEILRFLFESILEWSHEDIKRCYDKKLFSEYKLQGLLKYIFNDRLFQALNSVYPNQFKEWELKSTPKNFWNEETAIQATKWLIEEKLRWTGSDLKEKIDVKIFTNYGLTGMLKAIYHYCIWQAINAAYPNQFKEWELKNTPYNFWNETTAIQATKWLIEEKLKWTKEDIKEKLSQKVFIDNGLSGMLQTLYNSSPWQAINTAYPNQCQFKVWELKRVPNNFWNEITGIQATRWLIEEKLKWTDSEIKKYLQKQTFYDYGLYRMFAIIYRGNPYKAINAAYPGRFQKSDFILLRKGPKKIPKPQLDNLPTPASKVKNI